MFIKCLCLNKNYQQKFDEKLKERFLNTYKYDAMITINLFDSCKKFLSL